MTRKLFKNKTAVSKMLIVGVVIAVIVVAGVAGYYIATQNNPSPSASPTPSASASPTAAPSSEATPTAAPSQTASPSSSPNVAGASSLQYSVTVTSNGALQGSYTYYGKNAGTTNFMMRIDSTDPSGTQSIYIVNGQQQKAWVYSSGTWTDLSSTYTTQYSTWNTLWQGYVTSLAAWNGVGDYSNTANGNTVRIYDISVNPTLADSLFAPS